MTLYWGNLKGVSIPVPKLVFQEFNLTILATVLRLASSSLLGFHSGERYEIKVFENLEYSDLSSWLWTFLWRGLCGYR